MRANSLILVALLTLAGFGAGMIIGGRLASPKPAAVRSSSVSAGSDAQGNRLPAIKRRPKSGGSGMAAGPFEPSSVAEIEAALQKAIRMGSGRAYKTLNDLVQKVDPSDMPELLAFVEKSIAANHKSQLRSLLLSRWAETDVSDAMAYADKVPGYQDRQQAILTVLRAWADQDSEAATAWARQLPAGPLRQQALSAVSYALAQKNPEAAYALMTGSSPGDRRWGMTHEIFSAWAATDPAAAAAKAAQLGSGQQRQQAFQVIASQWARAGSAGGAGLGEGLAG